MGWKGTIIQIAVRMADFFIRSRTKGKEEQNKHR